MEPMHKINKVEVRNLQIEDYIQLSQSFKRVYADKDVLDTRANRNAYPDFSGRASSNGGRR